MITKQNISITRARTHHLKIRLTNADGTPRVMTAGEKLIFGVKRNLTDTAYAISKTINYQDGFERVEAAATPPQWEANKYYSKTTSGDVDTYVLTTSKPTHWDDDPTDSTYYTNHYIHNALYDIVINPSDTESLSPSTDYFYDVGLQSGTSDNVKYYSVIDTSKIRIEGNVTTKEA